MVAVLMGDQDPVDTVGTGAAQRLKAPQHFLFSKSSVDEESRAPRFEQRGVARAAGGQDGYAERDTIFLSVGARAIFERMQRRNG